MSASRPIMLDDEPAQEACGAALAGHLAQHLSASNATVPALRLYLEGELGAGKTTLARGLLRGLGHTGAVKSPTYTLVEPYRIDGLAVYHLDLYRVSDPGELEYLGLREMLAEPGLLIVEWPERGGAWLPEPDLRIRITHRPGGRSLVAAAATARGQAILARWPEDLE